MSFELSSQLRTPIKCLRYGCKAEDYRTSILVVSCDERISNFMEACLVCNRDMYSDRYRINVCESVTSLLSFGMNAHYDYIVLMVNPAKDSWSSEVEKNVSVMDKSYLCGRICLVVDTSDSCPADLYAVHNLKKKYALFTICGEINNEIVLKDMVKKIMKLVTQICCNKYSLPLLTQLPTY